MTFINAMRYQAKAKYTLAAASFKIAFTLLKFKPHIIPKAIPCGITGQWVNFNHTRVETFQFVLQLILDMLD